MTRPGTVVWQGRFLAMRVDGAWEYAERPEGIGGSVIVALDGDAAILVEQFRVPIGRRSLELPAGLIGDDIADEAIEASAARELEEETGYRAGSLRHLGLFTTSPGLTSETFNLVLATGLEKVGDGGGVGGEDIAVHRVPLAELPDFVEERRAAGVSIDVRVLILLGGMLLQGVLPPVA